MINSHFHSLDFDTPSGGGLVEHGLHGARDALSVAEDLVEVLGSEDVPQCGLRQKPSGVVRILHIGHRDSCVGDPVVDYCVHRHGHRVLGQNLKGEVRNILRNLLSDRVSNHSTMPCNEEGVLDITLLLLFPLFQSRSAIIIWLQGACINITPIPPSSHQIPSSLTSLACRIAA